jgi:hypothetical protein
MPFDLDAYKRRSERLRWDDLDLSAFGSDPLDAATLRCIRYMHDVEYHTICYLRDLLLTPAHADPEVTAFLSCWVYEEFWHGEALAAVLAAHREDAGRPRIAALRAALGWRDKVRPLLMTFGGWWGRGDLASVSLTWGAINEWTTQAGYTLLARRAGHPVLADLLSRIARQEGRHIDFYSSAARRRLASSPRARRLARFALTRFWHPVGAGVMPAEETSFLVAHLLTDEAGRAAVERVDRCVDRLPGLEGLRLLTRSAEALVPATVPT